MSFKATVEFGATIDSRQGPSPRFSVEVVIEKDGEQWCALAGVDLQQGVAGFGSTPADAIRDFKNSFRNDK